MQKHEKNLSKQSRPDARITVANYLNKLLVILKNYSQPLTIKELAILAMESELRMHGSSVSLRAHTVRIKKLIASGRFAFTPVLFSPAKKSAYRIQRATLTYPR